MVRTCAGSAPRSATDVFEFAGTLRILSSGHAGGEVIGYDHYHIAVLVDGVKKTGHSGVCESGVTDYGHRGELAGIGRSLGHSDRRSHVDAGVDCVESWESGRVAAYVAEHFRGFELFQGHR